MMWKMTWHVNEEVNRDETGKTDEMDLKVNSKDEVIQSERAISDFQWGDDSRKDNRWGASTQLWSVEKKSGCEDRKVA